MIEALLFDMDGTLVDSEPLHLEALRRQLVLHGRDVDLDAFHKSVVGRSNLEVAALLFPDDDTARHEALVLQKEGIYWDLARTLTAAPGLVDFLDLAHRRGWPVALVTNARRENAEHTLGILGLRDRFDVLVAADDVARVKPDPLPYLAALEALSADPGTALAFEDSLPGIRSATGAGIRTIGLSTGLNEADLLAAGAVRVIADFRNLAFLGDF